MSRVKADLFSLVPAPAPKPETLTLWDDDVLVVDQVEVSLDGIVDMGEVGLVVVAYVSSPDGGLLCAWWGEAALVPDGRLARLEWRHREPLDLTRPEATSGRPHLTVVVSTGDKTPEPPPRRFDSAELEETPLGVRTPLTAVTSEPEPPVAPAADSGDES